MQTLAADLACEVGDLLADRTTVTVFRPMPGRRRFPLRDPTFQALTVGAGAVVCVEAASENWAREALSPLAPGQVFSQRGIELVFQHISGQGMECLGPSVSYVCSQRSLRPIRRPEGFRFELLRGREIQKLYGHEGLQMSLSYYTEGERPDVLAAAAWRGEELAGVAGCSADSGEMWQVGIDVRPAWRRRGLGSSLVSEVTRAILACGKVPYYACGLHNLPSQRIAVGTGYCPAWTSIWSK